MTSFLMHNEFFTNNQSEVIGKILIFLNGIKE